LADLIEFAKYFAEFVLVVALILLLAYWPPKGRGVFGQRDDSDVTTATRRRRCLEKIVGGNGDESEPT